MEAISNNIDQYCFGQMEVWSLSKARAINMYDLKQKIENNINILKEINEKWKKMSNFLSIQRRWKVIYLHFLLFLKNQSLKSKEISFNTRDNEQFLTAATRVLK